MGSEMCIRDRILRSGLVVVNLRNERRRSGDHSRNVRIFQYCPNALPLLGDLGERAGVRGNEANFSPRRTTIAGLSNFASPPAEPGGGPNLAMKTGNLEKRQALAPGEEIKK